MKIPYVIDNQQHLMADILTQALENHRGQSLDIASAYFTVAGFGILQKGLRDLGSFRLLLGQEPMAGEQLGLRPDSVQVRGLLRRDLERLPFDEKTLRLIEDLIAYLHREAVMVRVHEDGFFHAKCWLFYSDRPGQQLLFDRFRPILAIVGSSNFTGPGLTSNRELNLAHQVLLDPQEVRDVEASEAVSWLSDQKPSEQITAQNRQLLKSEVGARAIIDLEQWFQRQWDGARDFKQDLIDVLDASKFGTREYTPYEVYMKALYEYFKDDLDREETPTTRSAVDLAEFQEHAVKKARKILSRYDGVMIADSVGLGKTWIGKKLLEDFAYHMRQKAVVICPASLKNLWERELRDASISAVVLTQEELGRAEFDAAAWNDADVVLIDESHNFRNPASQRYASLELLLGGNGGRGKAGARKKVLLLSATPINNDLLDLYHQICLVTRGDRSYFAGCGIGDLYKYFLKARREGRGGSGRLGLAIFNLLEEVVIRRTRPFIRKAYPEATIQGRRVRFPDRELHTIRYNLETTYAGIYDDVVSGIEGLKLAPYNLEGFKKAGVAVDQLEAGREQALVGIFKSRYLKRFESSVEAFRISVRRALEFLKTFESYILGGRLLRSADFHRVLRYLASEDEEDDATPTSLATDIDASDEARAYLDTLPSVDPSLYDLRRLHDAVQHDVEVLSRIWQLVRSLGPERDAKLASLKDLLSGELRGKKVLIFTYYKDTARYLYRQLGHPDNASAQEFCRSLGSILIRRMDSDADAKERVRIVEAFAPNANLRPELSGTDKEIDVLISTDVLSEGQNLQDCGYLLNYDLHWNPTRMVQRAGRIDRLGSAFDVLHIYNMFPDAGLERLLRLVENLSEKLSNIDQAGFLDASVLGETVHPRNFNTLRRIADEDGSVIEEEEQFTELASGEFLAQQLRTLLNLGGQDMLAGLPDGIHSGLVKPGARGAFFYFRGSRTGEVHHFWKYVDLRDNNRIVDNRYIVANLIACEPSTARVVDPDAFARVFEIQETVIADILQSFEQRQALEAAPRSLDPIQQTVATVIQGYLNHPSVDRAEAIAVIQFVSQPMLAVHLRELRAAYKSFQASSDPLSLIGAMRSLRDRVGASTAAPRESGGESTRLRREDLQLVCFDFLSGG